MREEVNKLKGRMEELKKQIVKGERDYPRPPCFRKSCGIIQIVEDRNFSLRRRSEEVVKMQDHLQTNNFRGKLSEKKKDKGNRRG